MAQKVQETSIFTGAKCFSTLSVRETVSSTYMLYGRRRWVGDAPLNTTDAVLALQLFRRGTHEELEISVVGVKVSAQGLWRSPGPCEGL